MIYSVVATSISGCDEILVAKTLHIIKGGAKIIRFNFKMNTLIEN
jgi:hypothetical protein